MNMQMSVETYSYSLKAFSTRVRSCFLRTDSSKLFLKNFSRPISFLKSKVEGGEGKEGRERRRGGKEGRAGEGGKREEGRGGREGGESEGRRNGRGGGRREIRMDEFTSQ